MRLVTYESDGHWRAGIIVDEDVVDSSIAAMAADIDFDSEWISNRELIQLSKKQLTRFENAAWDVASARNSDMDVFPIETARLGPPIPDPDKIICLGLNYKSHAEEAGLAIPKVPILLPNIVMR